MRACRKTSNMAGTLDAFGQDADDNNTFVLVAWLRVWNNDETFQYVQPALILVLTNQPITTCIFATTTVFLCINYLLHSQTHAK